MVEKCCSSDMRSTSLAAAQGSPGCPRPLSLFKHCVHWLARSDSLRLRPAKLLPKDSLVTMTDSHRRRTSAVRISVGGLDEDELSALSPFSFVGTPKSTQPLFEKYHDDSAYSSKAPSPYLGAPPSPQLAWKAPPRKRATKSLLRLGRRLLALGVAGYLVYVLVGSGNASDSSSFTRLKRFMGRGAPIVRKEPRTDHTYAYGTPLPNESGAYDEHPVHGLIREAKQEWAAKQARQSTSYYDAVREYQRRNGRDPPPGFKEWYRWAKEHNVQLIDEFDLINRQIEPFLALRPSTLRQRIAENEDLNSWGANYGMIYIGDGELEIAGAKWRPPVPEGFVELMKPLAHLLPNVTVPLHLHDGAASAQSYTALEAYRQAAREGYWIEEEKIKVNGDIT